MADVILYNFLRLRLRSGYRSVSDAPTKLFGSLEDQLHFFDPRASGEVQLIANDIPGAGRVCTLFIQVWLDGVQRHALFQHSLLIAGMGGGQIPDLFFKSAFLALYGRKSGEQVSHLYNLLSVYDVDEQGDALRGLFLEQRRLAGLLECPEEPDEPPAVARVIERIQGQDSGEDPSHYSALDAPDSTIASVFLPPPGLPRLVMTKRDERGLVASPPEVSPPEVSPPEVSPPAAVEPPSSTEADGLPSSPLEPLQLGPPPIRPVVGRDDETELLDPAAMAAIAAAAMFDDDEELELELELEDNEPSEELPLDALATQPLPAAPPPPPRRPRSVRAHVERRPPPVRAARAAAHAFEQPIELSHLDEGIEHESTELMLPPAVEREVALDDQRGTLTASGLTRLRLASSQEQVSAVRARGAPRPLPRLLGEGARLAGLATLDAPSAVDEEAETGAAETADEQTIDAAPGDAASVEAVEAVEGATVGAAKLDERQLPPRSARRAARDTLYATPSELRESPNFRGPHRTEEERGEGGGLRWGLLALLGLALIVLSAGLVIALVQGELGAWWRGAGGPPSPPESVAAAPLLGSPDEERVGPAPTEAGEGLGHLAVELVADPVPAPEPKGEPKVSRVTAPPSPPAPEEAAGGCVDQDGDGFVVCESDEQYEDVSKKDCNDEDRSYYPGAPESPGDGKDRSCDGRVACYADPYRLGVGFSDAVRDTTPGVYACVDGLASKPREGSSWDIQLTDESALMNESVYSPGYTISFRASGDQCDDMEVVFNQASRTTHVRVPLKAVGSSSLFKCHVGTDDNPSPPSGMSACEVLEGAPSLNHAELYEDTTKVTALCCRKADRTLTGHRQCATVERQEGKETVRHLTPALSKAKTAQ